LAGRSPEMEPQTANRPDYRPARSWGIDRWNDIAMKLAQLFFGIGYMLVTLAFAIAGLALVGFALVEIAEFGRCRVNYSPV
jgi:hypothetical protein